MTAHDCAAALYFGGQSYLPVHAADLDGTWRYDQGAEYFGQLKAVPPPEFQTLQISDGRLVLSSRCMVTLKPETYLYSDVFQALLKKDVSEAALRRRQ